MREVVPDATVAYELVRTYVRDSLVTERLMASLSGFFGLLAMLIATIGLYGVMSYRVGAGLAVFVSRWAASLLFGLKPWDPLSSAVAVALLGAVSLICRVDTGTARVPGGANRSPTR